MIVFLQISEASKKVRVLQQDDSVMSSTLRSINQNNIFVMSIISLFRTSTKIKPNHIIKDDKFQIQRTFCVINYRKWKGFQI